MTTITAAAEENVKLLGLRLSPFVLRATIALNLKGIKYDFFEEVFNSKSELLLRSNPVYKKVPVLIHDGKPVCESRIIVEYIDNVWEEKESSILPSDPYERATARFWATYIDDKMFPPLLTMLKAQTEEAKEEATSQFCFAMETLETAFVKCASGKPFFGGENIGFIDIALGSLISLIMTVKKLSGLEIMDKAKIPNLVEWAERFRSHEKVKEVVPEIDEFVELAKKLQDSMWKAQATS